MKHPCAECPFKRTSARGWLGPYRSARHFIEDTWQEEGMLCHMQTPIKGELADHCVGSLICANKSHKTYRNPTLQAEQRRAGRTDPEIMDAHEFIAYHGERK